MLIPKKNRREVYKYLFKGAALYVVCPVQGISMPMQTTCSNATSVRLHLLQLVRHSRCMWQRPACNLWMLACAAWCAPGDTKAVGIYQETCIGSRVQDGFAGSSCCRQRA